MEIKNRYNEEKLNHQHLQSQTERKNHQKDQKGNQQEMTMIYTVL